MSYEDDILTRANKQLRHEATQAAITASALEQIKQQALVLGKEVAAMLIKHDKRPNTVYLRKQVDEIPFKRRQGLHGQYSGVDRVYQYFPTHEAWKILNTRDEGCNTGNLGLTTDGLAISYHQTSATPNGTSLTGEAVTGIIDPQVLQPQDAIKRIESEAFKDSCASILGKDRSGQFDGYLIDIGATQLVEGQCTY